MRKIVLKNCLVLLATVLLLVACKRTTSDADDASASSVQKGTVPIEVQEHEGSNVSGEGRSYTVRFPSADEARTMEVFVPGKNDGERSLLILFHGYGDNAENFAKGLDAQRLADTLGVIVAVPQGLKNPKDGTTSWNAGVCCAFGDESRDDVALLTDIPAALESVTAFNKDVIDVAGFSNGGFFVEHLMCNHTHLIRGGLNVGGTLPMKAEDCNPEGPIRLLRVQGSDDERIPIAGGELSDGREMVGFNESFAHWRSKLKCSRAPNMTQRGFASCRQQFDCPNGHMEFCEVAQLKHEWPNARATGLDVFDVAWQVWTRSSEDD